MIGSEPPILCHLSSSYLRKAGKTAELFICFSHFPALLFAKEGSAAGTDIHVSPPLPPSLPHISIPPFQPFFPSLLLVIFSLLMINPRYKPPVSPVRLSFLTVNWHRVKSFFLFFFNEVNGNRIIGRFWFLIPRVQTD